MFWPRPGFKVTNCDLEPAVSAVVSWKRKSSGKRSALRLTALVEDARLDAVNPGEFSVENYPLRAKDEDRAADLLGRQRAGVHSEWQHFSLALSHTFDLGQYPGFALSRQ